MVSKTPEFHGNHLTNFFIFLNGTFLLPILAKYLSNRN